MKLTRENLLQLIEAEARLLARYVRDHRTGEVTDSLDTREIHARADRIKAFAEEVQ